MRGLKLIPLLFVMMTPLTGHGQEKDQVDSLRMKILNGASDSIKGMAALQLTNYYKERNVDSSYKYLDLASDRIDTTEQGELSARFFYNKSKLLFKVAKGEKAIEYSKKALENLKT